MVLIPAGVFLMGTSLAETEALASQHGYHPSWLSGEPPQREVDLPDFAIDRYPVTNQQYAEFCQATSHPAPAHWGGSAPPVSILDHPVIYVSRPDAAAYAAWAGKRLPTEAEWEKAARGADGRTFPWGNVFDPDACNWNRNDTGEGPPTPSGLEVLDNDWNVALAGENLRTTPVTAYPSGASPYGVMDMIGNAAEWCADPPGAVAYIKGGSWLTAKIVNLRAAHRLMSGFDTNISPFNGFRCAKDV